MKRFLVMLLVFVLLILPMAGCKSDNQTIGVKPELEIEAAGHAANQDKDGDDEKTPPDISSSKENDIPAGTAEPLVINAENGYIKILKPHSSYEKFRASDLDSWHDYILDKYNFDADVRFTSIKETSGFVIDTKSIIDSSEGGGFVYVQTLTQLNLLIESGLIVPVNETIGKVDIYNSINDEQVRAMSDSSGNLWAFPLSDSVWERGVTRTYDGEVLAMAQMDVPLTIDEFHDFAMFVAKTDVDGNGEFDTGVGEFSCATMLSDLRDIFRAFGIFNYGQSPIAYNPLKGVFENCVYNENFIEAMTFVKLLYDEGVLTDTFPMNDLGSGSSTYLNPGDYKCASSLWATPEHDFSSIAIGHYLIGNNDSMLVEKGSSPTCLAMLAETIDAAGQLNSFFRMLQANPGSFIDFAYGEEGVSYSEEDDAYIIKAVDSNGNYILKRLGIHIMLDNIGFKSKRITYNSRPDTGSEREFFSSMMEDAEKDARPVDPGVVYAVPLEGFGGQLDSLREKTYRATRDLFKNIIYGSTPIEDAVNQYMKAMDALKIPEAINSMNHNLIN